MNVSQAFEKADQIKRIVNSLIPVAEGNLQNTKRLAKKAHEAESFADLKDAANLVLELQSKLGLLSRAAHVSVSLQEQIDSINPDYPDPVTDQQEWAADVVDFSRDLSHALDALLSVYMPSSAQWFHLDRCKELLAEIGGLVQIVDDSWHDTQRGHYLCTVVVYGGLSEDGTSYAAYQNEDEHVVRFWDTHAVAACL